MGHHHDHDHHDHNHDHHHHAPETYPPPGHHAYPPPGGQAYPGPYVAPPPPVGYPTYQQAGAGYPHQQPHAGTNSGRDGFLKGCLAALCCCCLLEACI